MNANNSDDDLPKDIRQWSKFDYERAQNMRRLTAMSTGNRFRMLFGQPLLPERPSLPVSEPVERVSA